MDTSKWYLNSTTIRSALLACVPTIAMILRLFGIETSETEWGTFVDGVVGISGLIGFLGIVYGRAKASYKIRFTK